MFKSYRDIKSSLGISRERKVISRTSLVESSIVKALESKYGNLRGGSLSNDEVYRERSRRHNQTLSLERSRLRLFINKERRSRLQQERLNPFLDPFRLAKKDDLPENPAVENPKLRRTELTY